MTTTDVRRHRSETTSGVMAGVSLATAVAPLGIALGVSIAETSAPSLVGWASAPLLIAGASQLVLLSQLDGGAGVLAAAFAAVLVNARFVVYGAALATRFAEQPAWFRWIGPWFLVDQTYSLVARGAPPSDDGFRRFYLGAALFLFMVWSASVAVGIAVGPVLPGWLPLEFVLPAMFVALVVPGLQCRSEVLAAVAGATSALALPSPFALGVAALAGAGMTVARDETSPA